MLGNGRYPECNLLSLIYMYPGMLKTILFDPDSYRQAPMARVLQNNLLEVSFVKV